MYIDIKIIKLFDCLQCLSFPSMREKSVTWVRAKSCNRTGFGRSYGNYRMGPDRIYGKLREITIFRYRDSAPLPVRMRNGRYISYFTHQLDYNKFIYFIQSLIYLFP